MEKKEISEYIESLIEALVTEESFKLRALSNKWIRKAALENDKRIANVALMAYSLHKHMTKEHIVKSENWPKEINTLKTCLVELNNSVNQGETIYDKSMSKMVRCLRDIDEQDSRFMQSIWDKSKIKYAADAYYAGLSLGSAAELTGADRKTLQDYIGATRQFEKEKITYTINQRLSFIKQRWKL